MKQVGQNLIASIDGTVITKKVADKAEREKMVGIVAGYLKKPTQNVLAIIKKFFVTTETKVVDKKTVKKVEKKLAKDVKKTAAKGAVASTVTKDIVSTPVPKETEAPKRQPIRRGGEW